MFRRRSSMPGYTKNNLMGFGTLKTILIIVGALVIIFIGLTVWRVNTPVTVKIPPLNAELKVPFVFNNLTYKVIPSVPIGGQTVTDVGLSTSLLSKYGASCSAGAAPLGSIYKVTGEYSADGSKGPRSNYFKFIKQYNGYYMYYTVNTSAAGCSSNSSIASKLQAAYLKNLEALNFPSAITLTN